MRTRLALSLSAALLPAAAWAQPLPGAEQVAALESFQQALFAKVAPSVVYISTGAGLGSGFFVSDDGLILTSAHVVGKAAEVNVILHSGEKLKGRVQERGRDAVDVALVKIERGGTPALPLAPGTQLRIGTWVAAVGHGAGGLWTFNTGMVTNLYPAGDAHPVFQTQIPVNPGNSGGPVLNRAGEVVGLVTAGVKGASLVNFAVRIDQAALHLEGLSSHCECLVIHAPAKAPIFVGGRRVGEGPKVTVPVKPGQHVVRAVVGGQLKQKSVRFPETRELRF